MKINKYKFLTLSSGIVVLTLALTGCGGGGSSAGPSSQSGGVITNPTVAGLAAHGAPIAEGTITIYDATGATVNTQTTTPLGAWTLSVSDSLKTSHPFPWLIKGEAAGLPIVWSIAFESDVGASGQSVNINPFTTATLVAAGVNVGDGTADAADMAVLSKITLAEISKVGETLSSVLSSAFEKLPQPPTGNVFEQLRSTPFYATSTGLDAVLDNVPIRVQADGKINITVPTIGTAISIDSKSNTPIATQATTAKTTVDSAVEVSGALLQVPPTLVAFDTQTSWGSTTDSWAGFTGAATVLSTKNYPKNTVIKFVSKKFPAAGWWGATAMSDATTGEISLTIPEWTSLTKGTPYSVGFNGTSSAATFEEAVKNATGCRINGDPCVITFGSAKSTDLGTLPTASYFSTFGKFFTDATKTQTQVAEANKAGGTSTANVINGTTTSSGSSTTTPVTADKGVSSTGSSTTPLSETKPTTSINTSSSAAASYLVTVSSGGAWATGFSGTITVKNTSTSPIASWSVTLPVAKTAFAGAPAAWNGTVTYAEPDLIIKPASWAKQSLAPGETWSSGFNGGLAATWLSVVNTSNVTFQADTTLTAVKTAQSNGGTTISETTSTVETKSSTTSSSSVAVSSPPAAPVSGGMGESSGQNWQKDPGTTSSTATAANPCNSVRWGDVNSVSAACLALMDQKVFGGPQHTNDATQIPLNNGKPVLEAFGYLVEWSVYGRKFGVENVAAAQYSKLLFSFLRLKPDGSLMITDEWASLQKDDTGTLLGLASDPFSSTWENQDRGIMKRLTMLKARFPHLKTAYSIGGWTLSGQFSSVTANPTTRANLVKSAISFANKFGFDGIDIDWEYPVVGGNLDSSMPGVNYAEANPGTAADAANYVLFLKELREAITAGGAKTDRSRTKTGKIELSIAVGLGPRTIDAVNFADFIDYLDTVNLMSYDFNGGWSSVVSHNAPLYDNQGLTGPKGVNSSNFDQSEFNNHDAVLNILWNLKNQKGKVLRADGELGKARFHKNDNGATSQTTRNSLMSDETLAGYRKKMVMGVPFYGRGWSSSAAMPAGDVTSPWFSGSGATLGSLEKGVADTKDIIYARDNQTSKITAGGRASTWPSSVIPAANFKWDPTACANFVWISGNIFSFDDEDAIYHKAKYVKDNGLGGVMVWEVDGDTDQGALAKSFVSGLRAGTTPPKGKTCNHAAGLATR